MYPLSSKYTNLIKAEKAGLLTPKTLLLTDFTTQQISAFLQQYPTGSRFIVRSIQSSEDAATQSFAGHFWSSDALMADEVLDAISQAQQENQRRLDQLDLNEVPQLILQQYIEHSIGGVLFSPWSFFADTCFIEYSTQSVQAVVAGDANPAVISLDNAMADPLALPDKLAFLKQPLRQLTQQLRHLFAFPIDAEWAYCAKQQAIVLLQLRPQTGLVGALFNASADRVQQLNLPKADWQYTALSESLGKLSPLSFSLLEQLYNDARAALQAIGYRAKQVNFMYYLPDGSIVVNRKAETEFYAQTLFGGFLRGFKAPQWQQKISQFFASIQLDNDFSYTQLSLYFQYWLVANALSKGQGRDKVFAVHAYELSWQQALEKPVIEQNDQSWATLNKQLKQLFFFELEKLKQQLKATPNSVLGTWKDQQILAANKAKIEMQAKQALYDYSLLGCDQATQQTQSIGAKKEVTGSLFIINNPSLFHQALPADSIIIAPYFDNQWIQNIPQLSAIIVRQGGYLSHSAIIAREAGIPYIISQQQLGDEFQQGDNVRLSLAGILTID
jgi:phosphohistidine swiveling domain-containing protein